MFTGLIEHKGLVIANVTNGVANQLLIKASLTDLEQGESIALNGVCLTLLSVNEDVLVFDVSPETLSITTLGQLQPGDLVNLERAMLATGRFGGHYVSGHVDTTVCLQSSTILGNYVEWLISGFSAASQNFLLPKGSIALNGVSLTINEVAKVGIKLMLVPHTLAHTTFSDMRPGQKLNVEFDYFTRIVAHQLTITGQLRGDIKL